MSKDDILYLVSEIVTENDMGDFIKETTESMIFAKKKSVRQSEFYQAAANGLKPELVFEIHAFEYNEEKKVKYNDKYYTVIRTYQINDDDLELVCEGGVHNGNA